MLMPFAGTVVGVQTCCTDVAGASATCDVRKNGVLIIARSLAHTRYFTDNPSNDFTSSLTSATFAQGDTLSFFIDSTNGTVLVNAGSAYSEGASRAIADGILLKSNGAWCGDELDNAHDALVLMESIAS